MMNYTFGCIGCIFDEDEVCNIPEESGFESELSRHTTDNLTPCMWRFTYDELIDFIRQYRSEK